MIATYILRCGDGSFYVGSTWNLDARIHQHMTGSGGAYTAERQPAELVWYQECERVDAAWALERKIHGWSRAKKQALIDGRFDLLPGLSRKRQ